MHSKRHKRKTNHVVIVTSDAVDANVKQFKIRPWILQVIILILCIIIGGLIGYFLYEEKLWAVARARNSEQQETVKVLEDENLALQSQIDSLNDQIQILSDTVNQKVPG